MYEHVTSSTNIIEFATDMMIITFPSPVTITNKQFKTGDSLIKSMNNLLNIGDIHFSTNPPQPNVVFFFFFFFWEGEMFIT